MAITFMVAVTGLILSLAMALLAAELIFGQVMRLFFVRRAVAVQVTQKLSGPEQNPRHSLHSPRHR